MQNTAIDVLEKDLIAQFAVDHRHRSECRAQSLRTTVVRIVGFDDLGIRRNESFELEKLRTSERDQDEISIGRPLKRTAYLELIANKCFEISIDLTGDCRVIGPQRLYDDAPRAIAAPSSTAHLSE